MSCDFYFLIIIINLSPFGFIFSLLLVCVQFQTNLRQKAGWLPSHPPAEMLGFLVSKTYPISFQLFC